MADLWIGLPCDMAHYRLIEIRDEEARPRKQS